VEGYKRPKDATHRRSISKWGVLAATAAAALVAAACGDAFTPGEEVLSTAELLILPQKPEAPAPEALSFYVVNSRASIQLMLHPDQFNNLYLELQFSVGSLDAVNGEPVGASDSVFVTVQPRPGAYGFTLSPTGLLFSAASVPRATFSYARYGELSVADASPSYADRASYAAALEIWAETTIDRWRRPPGSSAAGTDAVSGPLATGGDFVLAAPR
jgi:hypothetical protein